MKLLFLPSFVPALLLGLLPLLLWFMVITKKFINIKSKTNLPPGPWKLPLIGNLHQIMLSPLPHYTFRDLSKKHGPLMHLQLGEVSAVVISSPKVAEQVMKTHDLIFADRSEILAAKILSYDCTNVAFSPYGNYWRQLRRIFVLELLSAKQVRSFRSLREEEISNLIQSISFVAGSEINISHRLFLFTNDVICRATYGKKCNEKEEFKLAIQEALTLAGGFDISDVFPSLNFLHFISGLKPKLEKLHQKIDRILDNIIEEHKKNQKRNQANVLGEIGEDLVDVLLRVQENGELEFPITNDNIKAVILDIITAGTETSSSTTEWALAEMLKQPKVMEKAQAEVRNVLKGTNGEVDEREIPKLSYLKLVIKETFRLHPPLPLLIPRLSRESCQIDGYEIPKNTKIMVNAWAIGRDPTYWSDAESFNPERFNGSSIDYKGTNFEYIPFGAGRRMCPGLALGTANMELLLAHLLYHFDWKLSCDVKPEDLDMSETFGATVQRSKNLCLIPIPYSPPSPYGAGRRMCPGLTLGTSQYGTSTCSSTIPPQLEAPKQNQNLPEELDMLGSFDATIRRQNDSYLIPVPLVIFLHLFFHHNPWCES